MSRYAKIRRMDISNGPGIRVSIFFQGCRFFCKDCFNPETWDFNGGQEFRNKTIEAILMLCDKDYIAGLSILGGEPLVNENQQAVLELLTAFKHRFPDKNVWLWTGFKLRELFRLKGRIPQILDLVDYLVDDVFISSKKRLNLNYRGSSNQTIWEKSGDKWIVSKYNNK